MPTMVDEYMSWTEKLGDKGMSEAPTSLSSEAVEGTMHLHVIDVFHEFLNEFYYLVSDPPLPEPYSVAATRLKVNLKAEVSHVLVQVTLHFLM